MKIRRLTIHGFGTFSQGKELAFSEDSINVVAGDNEAGKSTLVAALYGIVFGFARAGDERLHRPWAECERYAGEVEIAEGTKTIKVARDFDTNHCSLMLIESGTESELFLGEANPRGRDQGYAKALEDALGISNGSVVAKTSVIRQLDMRTDIDAEVRQLVSGARRGDFQNTLDAMQTQFADLTRHNPWGLRDRHNDRAVEIADKEVADLKARRRELREHLDRIGALAIDIDGMRTKVEELAAARRSDEVLLERLTRLTDEQHKMKRLEQRLQEIRREKHEIATAKERLVGIGREMAASFGGFADLPEDFPQRLRDLASAMGEATTAGKHAEEQDAKAQQLTRDIAGIEEKIHNELPEFVGLASDFLQKLTSFREKQQRLHNVRSRSEEIRQQLAELDRGIDRDSARFAGADDGFPDKVRELMGKREHLASLEAKQARENETRLEDECLREQIQHRIKDEFAPFAQAGPNVRVPLIELSERRAAVLRLEQALLAARDRLRTVETRRRRARYSHVAGAVVGALGGVCIGLLVAKGPVVEFFLAAIAAAMGWMAISYALGSTTREFLDLSAETDELAQEAQNAARAVDALCDELGPLADFSLLQDQLARLEQHDQLVGQRTALEARIAAYADEAALEQEIAVVGSEVAQLAQELAPATKGGDDLATVVDDFEAFQSRCREAEGCRRTLAAVLEIDPADPQDNGIMDRLEAELEGLRPSLRGLELRPDRDEVVRGFKEYQGLREESRDKQSILKSMAEQGGHQARLDTARDRVRACQQNMGVPVDSDTDMDALGERYRRYERLRQEQGVSEAVVSRSKDEGKLASEEASAFAQYGTAERAVDALIEEAPYMRGFMDDPSGMAHEAEQARQRSQAVARDEKRLADELRQKEIDRRALETQGGGDMEELDSTIGEREDHLARLRRQASALHLAVDTLSQAARDYQAQHAARIAQGASEIFSIVTCGRYSEVALDDEFVPSALARSGAEPAMEHSLSCGTRDQLYLALRVAVARELAQRVALPFIMDDPFVHFDDARVDAARRVLDVIRGCHQVIIFTHDRRCLSWAGANVIEL